jgi:NAD(P)H dehydrogenase (quinone)
MPKILIVYYSKLGHTRQMAKFIENGAKEEGITVLCKSVAETCIDDLVEADGIIIGSPTYYGSMAAPVKELFDKSISCHGKLAGKVGGAFSSSAYIAGGNETTILDILHAMLVHGMIIQGDCSTDHFGPVALNNPDEICREKCERFGRRISLLTKSIYNLNL